MRAAIMQSTRTSTASRAGSRLAGIRVFEPDEDLLRAMLIGVQITVFGLALLMLAAVSYA